MITTQKNLIITIHLYFQGHWYFALPERHLLPKIHLEELSWGEKDNLKIIIAGAQVLEMMNKKLDFEALRKHARIEYWDMEEVQMFLMINLTLVSIYPHIINIDLQIQVFIFFSHQGVTNNSFPCNTVSGSKMGKMSLKSFQCFQRLK